VIMQLFLRSITITFLIASWFCLTSSSVIVGKRDTCRTEPPAGAVVVTPHPYAPGEFATVQGAVSSLPNDASSQSIFIYPGTYTEQVVITRPGQTTIFGSTVDTSDYKSNTVTIQFGGSASLNGTDEASGTLQTNKVGFALYNINLRNTFGVGSQALAISAIGDQHGFYGSAFFGWQDTVLSNSGNHFYGHCYIEGATDFIWGQHARAFITKTDIAVAGAGWVTASGRNSSTDPSFYVIDQSNVFQSVNANSSTSLTGKSFLGRPWGEFARVAFTSTSMSDIINTAGWAIWATATPNTVNSTFLEFNNTGTGSVGPRANFSSEVDLDTGLDIASILGTSYTSWVDLSYL